MPYKIDTHVHTSESSFCACVSAFDTVDLYKKASFDAIIITNHFAHYCFDALKGDSDSEKITSWLSGYDLAEKRGKQVGLRVYLGMEINFPENRNDYLVFGFDRNFLYENSRIAFSDLATFRAVTKGTDICVFQAHPFRPNMIPVAQPFVDGIEIFNGNVRHCESNDKSDAWALDHNLLISSGSDFHQIVDVARGGISVDTLPGSEAEIFSLLRSITRDNIIANPEGIPTHL
ncbi:MAG: transposase [Oscillospiraceae bacterium]|nr:transposase [Oscillospiraceae bacterium]